MILWAQWPMVTQFVSSLQNFCTCYLNFNLMPGLLPSQGDIYIRRPWAYILIMSSAANTEIIPFAALFDRHFSQKYQHLCKFLSDRDNPSLPGWEELLPWSSLPVCLQVFVPDRQLYLRLFTRDASQPTTKFQFFMHMIITIKSPCVDFQLAYSNMWVSFLSRPELKITSYLLY